MVDSSYFKNNKNNGNRAGGKNNGKLKPFVLFYDSKGI